MDEEDYISEGYRKGVFKKRAYRMTREYEAVGKKATVHPNVLWADSKANPENREGGGTETPLDDYDEPGEVRRAIHRTPTAGGGGFWDGLKSKFIMSPEEKAREDEIKSSAKEEYYNAKEFYARQKAAIKARKEVLGKLGEPPKKKVRAKRYRTKIIGGIPYQVAEEDFNPRGNTRRQKVRYVREQRPQRNLDDLLTGGVFGGGGTSAGGGSFRSLDEVLLGDRSKRGKKRRDPLSILNDAL